MQAFVSGEKPFRSQRLSFAVAPTTAGYTLEYSVDKENWTAYPDAVPANENLMVNMVPIYMWFRLKGNSDKDVQILL